MLGARSAGGRLCLRPGAQYSCASDLEAMTGVPQAWGPRQVCLRPGGHDSSVMGYSGGGEEAFVWTEAEYLWWALYAML